MAEKERMQPFWYQGNLIDPNEELPFPLEQLEAENAWNDICLLYTSPSPRD